MAIYKIGNKLLTNLSGKFYVKEQPPQPTIPAYTIRFKFDDTTKTPPTPNVGTFTAVDASQGIWDWHYENVNWCIQNSASGRFIDNYDTVFRGMTDYAGVILEVNALEVENMGGLFANLYKIRKINNVFIGEKKLKCTTLMFCNCASLTEIPYFDTSEVTECKKMFQRLASISLSENIWTTIPNFDFRKSKSAIYMFQNCTNIVHGPTLSLDSAEDTYNMFGGCTNMLDVNITNTQNLKTCEYMFSDCNKLKHVYDFDVDSLVNAARMYSQCWNVEDGITSFYNKVKNILTSSSSHSYMFNRCGIYTSADSERAALPVDWGGSV